MYFSDGLLTRKGPLANVWLAANWEKKLSKAHVQATDIPSTVEGIMSETQPMALRLSGQLLLGTTRIYGRQTRYLWEDCTDAMLELQGSKATEQAEPSHHIERKAPRKTDANALPETANLIEEQPISVEEILRAIPTRRQAPNSPSHSIEAARDVAMDEGFGPAGDDEPNPFLMDMQFGSERQSIEVGRRAVVEEGDVAARSSLAAMLPTSPMRRSSGLVNPADLLLDGVNVDGADVDDQNPLFSSPQVEKVQRPRKRHLKAAAATMDRVTELSNSQVHTVTQENQEGAVPQTPEKRVRKMDVAEAERLLNGPGVGTGLESLFAACLNVDSPSAPVPQMDPQNEAEDVVMPEMDDDIQVPTFEPDESSNAEQPPSLSSLWSAAFAQAKSSIVPLAPNLVPEPRDRHNAASAFFETLLQASQGRVRVQQDEPFGPIMISLLL